MPKQIVESPEVFPLSKFSDLDPPNCVPINMAVKTEGATMYTKQVPVSPEGKSVGEGNSLADLGFTLVPGEHPIIPVMLGEARLAQDMAAQLLEHGIYVIGFSFPVVPRGQARIRTQMSAAHSRQDLERALEAFATVGRQLGVIS